MATGFLTPDARLRILNDLGLIQAGAKLNTYVAGTPSTPIQTFTDVGLTTPNANPVVASAGGLFGPIYLTPGVSYKFVLTDALGNVLWSQDNIGAPGGVATVPNGGTGVATLAAHGVLIGEGTSPVAVTTPGTTGQVLTSNGASADPTFQNLNGDNGVNDFRLTLSSGVPVTTSDVLAAATLYATLYVGNRIALFDAAGVPTLISSAQVSIAVPAVANQVYDVFGFNNGGVFTLELLAWTNDTTRATAIVLTTTGTYTKSGDLTRRYLGTFRTTAVAGQTEDSKTKRYLYNHYHRIARALLRLETNTSWTYNGAFRQANGAAANQVEAVIGVQEVATELTVTATAQAPVAGRPSIAISDGSTLSTSVDAACAGAAGGNTNTTDPQLCTLTARLVKFSPVGLRVYGWLEAATSATTTWYGTPASPSATAGTANGMVGSVEG